MTMLSSTGRCVSVATADMVVLRSLFEMCAQPAGRVLNTTLVGKVRGLADARVLPAGCIVLVFSKIVLSAYHLTTGDRAVKL